MTFYDQITSRLGTESCFRCEKPTQSHALLIAFDTDREEFVTVDNPDDADTVRSLCHTCYVDLDGDPERAAAVYDAYVRELADDANSTVREFYEQAMGEGDE